MLWWILGYMYLFQLWFSSDICLGVQPLDHILTLFLIFKGISSLFFIVAAPVYIPTNSVEGSPFSTSPAFVICRLFDVGRSEWTFIISLDLDKWTFAPGLCPWCLGRWVSTLHYQKEGTGLAEDEHRAQSLYKLMHVHRHTQKHSVINLSSCCI